MSGKVLVILCMQVCLAAEQCGHLDFDIRQDMWWDPEGFYCGNLASGQVRFRDIFLKVCGRVSLPAAESCPA